MTTSPHSANFFFYPICIICSYFNCYLYIFSPFFSYFIEHTSGLVLCLAVVPSWWRALAEMLLSTANHSLSSASNFLLLFFNLESTPWCVYTLCPLKAPGYCGRCQDLLEVCFYWRRVFLFLCPYIYACYEGLLHVITHCRYILGKVIDQIQNMLGFLRNF